MILVIYYVYCTIFTDPSKIHIDSRSSMYLIHRVILRIIEIVLYKWVLFQGRTSTLFTTMLQIICMYLSFNLSALKWTPSTLVAGSNFTSRRSSTILTFSSSVWQSPNICCSRRRAPSTLGSFLMEPVVERRNLAKKRSSQTTARARWYSRRKSQSWSSLRSPT